MQSWSLSLSIFLFLCLNTKETKIRKEMWPRSSVGPQCGSFHKEETVFTRIIVLLQILICSKKENLDESRKKLHIQARIRIGEGGLLCVIFSPVFCDLFWSISWIRRMTSRSEVEEGESCYKTIPNIPDLPSGNEKALCHLIYDLKIQGTKPLLHGFF